MKQFQALRGMRDLLPEDTRRWQVVEAVCAATFARYAYEEVRLPLLESTALFARGVGEATDIVEKEMYSLPSRDEGDAVGLTLRPEGTAGCARALQQHGMLYNQTQRVWYRGSMFRYERPQKGRYRQFEQFGAEVFGIAEPAVEAELILMCAEAFGSLGLLDALELQLNTLGAGPARIAYRTALVDYLTPQQSSLDPDSRRRLTTNPLRILDSKSEQTQEILRGAPKLPEFVDAQARAHFDELQRLLQELGVSYRVNTGLVRGLDYYTHTVFEWVTTALGAQGTVCGGGRYDGLVELLGGKPTPGAGFAMGIDRLVLLHEALQQPVNESQVDVFIALASAAEQGFGLRVAQRLHEELPGLKIRTHIGGGKLKAQMKRADASGAQAALIVGEAEAAGDSVRLKWLRAVPADASGEQQTVPVDELAQVLASRFDETGRATPERHTLA